ncbi:MAG: hypothetical protein AABM40_04285 [Chloroflexota bacterium]
MSGDQEQITATRVQVTFREFLGWFFFVAVLGTFPLLAAVIWNSVTTHTYDTRAFAIFKEGEMLGPAYAICGAAIAQWFGKENLGGWGAVCRQAFVGSNLIFMMTILVFLWGISLHSLGSLSYGSNPEDVQQSIVGLSGTILVVVAGWGAIGQFAYWLLSR